MEPQPNTMSTRVPAGMIFTSQSSQYLPLSLPAHSARNSLREGLVTLKDPQRPPGFLTLFMAAVGPAELFSPRLAASLPELQPRILQPPSKARPGLHYWR